jgi:hypothetical protein
MTVAEPRGQLASDAALSAVLVPMTPWRFAFFAGSLAPLTNGIRRVGKCAKGSLKAGSCAGW